MASRGRVPINIAQAMSCAAKMRSGKSCTAAEMKATSVILSQALSSSRAATRAAKEKAAEAMQMVQALLSRVG